MKTKVLLPPTGILQSADIYCKRRFLSSRSNEQRRTIYTAYQQEFGKVGVAF